MKKLFAIAFTCVYLTLAVGVVRTTHYCMGRVKTSTLFSFESIKCQCALFAKPGQRSCCDDDHELIKIESDHAAASVVSIAPDFFYIATLLSFDHPIDIGPAHLTHSIGESPPPLTVIPLFEKYCSRVFYDSFNA